MLTLITVAATAVAYRAALHILSKKQPGTMARKAAKILGGGGPGEE